jgi:ubiquinone/menaquinone biosynthesis C-methylase UbiE
VADQDVRDAYASAAQLYIALFGSGAHEHPDDLAFIAEHLPPGAGRVLDVGCGPGQLSGHLASLGVDVGGVDLVPEFIQHARLSFPQIAFGVGSMQALDADDGEVGGILAWYSLIHLDPADLNHVLREFRRALSPGGSLVIGLFDGPPSTPFEHKVVTAYHWSLETITERLAHAGFAVTASLRRGQDGERRPHLAIAALAH